MSSVREARLWQWLNGAKYVLRERLHMTRVENLLSRGMPDVEGCLDGVGFWIELKCHAWPRDVENTPIRLRFESEQAPWLSRRWRAGGRVFVLLQLGSGHNARRLLLPGFLATALQDGDLTVVDMRNSAAVDPTATAARLVEAAAGYSGFSRGTGSRPGA